MFDLIKQIFRNLKFEYWRSSSEKYVTYLRKKGVRIGENVTFHDPRDTVIDITQPTLIEIGNNVEITKGVVVLCHDLAWAVQKQLNGDVLGCNRAVHIGNNVFVGINAIILEGVEIGDNIVIGSGSVVTKDLDSDAVYAGVPAKKICSLQEFFLKRKKLQVDEAKELLQSYQIRYGTNPPKDLFRDFFFLFEERSTEIKLIDSYDKILSLGGNREVSLHKFHASQPIFNGYHEFLKQCGLNNDKE
ncbi:acyltransferase [Allofournierella sp.]|uniref:acyltransferase n=1 Tax=Allofournierella sp. TaxID=1940256 RepID=UPI003AB75315